MTETKSQADIAQSCRVLSDAMLDLATDFDYYLNDTDKAKYLLQISALLQMYGRQIGAKMEPNWSQND